VPPNGVPARRLARHFLPTLLQPCVAQLNAWRKLQAHHPWTNAAHPKMSAGASLGTVPWPNLAGHRTANTTTNNLRPALLK
jgi:hypothetical protein